MVKKIVKLQFKNHIRIKLSLKKVRTNKLQTALNNLKVGYELLDSQK